MAVSTMVGTAKKSMQFGIFVFVAVSERNTLTRQPAR